MLRFVHWQRSPHNEIVIPPNAVDIHRLHQIHNVSDIHVRRFVLDKSLRIFDVFCVVGHGVGAHDWILRWRLRVGDDSGYSRDLPRDPCEHDSEVRSFPHILTHSLAVFASCIIEDALSPVLLHRTRLVRLVHASVRPTGPLAYERDGAADRLESKASYGTMR